MTDFSDTLQRPALYDRKARLRLNVVIVGCGLGGLAAAFCMSEAGHNVTILEGARALAEVGAGIQIGPNVSRLLIRWGLGEKLAKYGVIPQAISLRRYDTGERVGWTKWGDRMEEDHKAPYYHIHRADFHKLLYDLAAPLINLRLASRVVSVDPSRPSLQLESGEVVHADLIIGADGIKSRVRDVLARDQPRSTGEAAYRAIIPTELMVKDPMLKHLVDEVEMTGWMGPKKHIMAYCIRERKEYNIVMVHPNSALEESYTAEGSVQRMRADFADWEPRVQKLLQLVPSTLIWPLIDRQPLDHWVHKDGRVVLLGDACHPMLPYRAQGSAMAIEDAAVLGNLFSRLSHPGQIMPLLQGYFSLRHPRASSTQRAASNNGGLFHLEDGPEQEARDNSMRLGMEASLREARGEVDTSNLEGNANIWADKTQSHIQFDYDADEEANQWWREHPSTFADRQVEFLARL